MVAVIAVLLVLGTLAQGRPQFLLHSNGPGNELGYRLGNGFGNRYWPQNNFGHVQTRRIGTFGRFGGFGDDNFSAGYSPVTISGYPTGVAGNTVGLNGFLTVVPENTAGLNGYPNEIDQIENEKIGLEGFGFGSNDDLSYLDFLLTRLSYKNPEQ